MSPIGTSQADVTAPRAAQNIITRYDNVIELPFARPAERKALTRRFRARLDWYDAGYQLLIVSSAVVAVIQLLIDKQNRVGIKPSPANASSKVTNKVCCL